MWWEWVRLPMQRPDDIDIPALSGADDETIAAVAADLAAAYDPTHAGEGRRLSTLCDHELTAAVYSERWSDVCGHMDTFTDSPELVPRHLYAPIGMMRGHAEAYARLYAMLSDAFGARIGEIIEAEYGGGGNA